MTTAEMIASVEARIRKDIPRLMELREGCLVGKDNEVFRIEENPKGDGYYVGRYFYLYEESIAERYEIIGHDIMLNDVLEWGLMNKLFNVELIHKTLRMKPYKNLLHLNDYGRWDLSKSYFKNQSAELVKFLYNLKKNKSTPWLKIEGGRGPGNRPQRVVAHQH